MSTLDLLFYFFLLYSHNATALLHIVLEYTGFLWNNACLLEKKFQFNRTMLLLACHSSRGSCFEFRKCKVARLKTMRRVSTSSLSILSVRSRSVGEDMENSGESWASDLLQIVRVVHA